MKHIIKKQTVLIGNTSFRTEVYQTTGGQVREVSVKDVAPNPITGRNLGDEPEEEYARTSV